MFVITWVFFIIRLFELDDFYFPRCSATFKWRISVFVVTTDICCQQCSTSRGGRDPDTTVHVSLVETSLTTLLIALTLPLTASVSDHTWTHSSVDKSSTTMVSWNIVVLQDNQHRQKRSSDRAYKSLCCAVIVSYKMVEVKFKNILIDLKGGRSPILP